MSASPDDDDDREDEKNLAARVTAMGESETQAFLLRCDMLQLEGWIGAMVHRWGMKKTIELLHAELADLEVHG